MCVFLHIILVSVPVTLLSSAAVTTTGVCVFERQRNDISGISSVPFFESSLRKEENQIEACGDRERKEQGGALQ